MEQQSYKIQKASDGQLAWDQLSDVRPDLIILDVMMPNKTGVELATEIWAMDHLAEVQILSLTGKSSNKDRRTGYGRGGDRYLIKPFDNDELVERVKDILHLEESSPGR